MERQETQALCCWICLGEDGILHNPCECPRHVHKACLAKWQINNIGREEEDHCRFCLQILPDWRTYFEKENASNSQSTYFRVRLNGYDKKLQVATDGFDSFEQQVREAFNIDERQGFDIVYTCKLPGAETTITLNKYVQCMMEKEKRQHLYKSAIYLACLSQREHAIPVNNPAASSEKRTFLQCLLGSRR